MGNPQGIKPIVFSPDALAWDRHQGQTVAQHGYLMEFLKLGRARSYTDLHAITKKSIDYLRHLGSAHRWREIAEVFDTEADRKYLTDLEEERRKAAKEKLGLSKKLTVLASRILDKNRDEEIGVEVAIRAALAVSKIQADVFNVPSHVNVEVSGPGGGPVTVRALDTAQLDNLSAAEAEALINELTHGAD